MTQYDVVPAKWPEAYFPLWYRCVDRKARKAGKGAVEVRCDGEWELNAIKDYFTHEDFGMRAQLKIDPRDRMIRLLALPGTYSVKYHTTDGECVDEVTVRDPLACAVEARFRDGWPLFHRDGKYDRFIINENPYTRLPIPKGCTVLDLGAHIGTFARDAHRRGAARVVSYEPEPVNFMFLSRNTAGLPVERHEAAVSREAGTGVLYLSWTDGGLGSGGNSLFKTQSGRPPVSVRVESVEDVMATTQPHVVKLDVKGAECELDWGSLRWPATVEAVALEADVDFMLNTVDPALKENGFHQVRFPPQNGWKRTVAIWSR